MQSTLSKTETRTARGDRSPTRRQRFRWALRFHAARPASACSPHHGGRHSPPTFEMSAAPPTRHSPPGGDEHLWVLAETERSRPLPPPPRETEAAFTASQAFHRQGALRPFPQRSGGLPKPCLLSAVLPAGAPLRGASPSSSTQPRPGSARRTRRRLPTSATKREVRAQHRTLETSLQTPFSDSWTPRRAASGGAPRNGWCLESTCPPRSETRLSVRAMRTEAHSDPTRRPVSPSRHSAEPGGNREEDASAKASFQPVARTIRPSASPGSLLP